MHCQPRTVHALREMQKLPNVIPLPRKKILMMKVNGESISSSAAAADNNTHVTQGRFICLARALNFLETFQNFRTQ